MKKQFFLVFICILTEVNAWSDNKIRKFKDEFLFGVSTSAYQIEGAWNVDGKGESIWDTYAHNTRIKVHSSNINLTDLFRNGDKTCDSYSQYQRDVQMLRELGVDFYRFSISWSRILPNGFPDEINEKGLEYYDSLICELLKYNIKPMVTLFQFDLPQNLQNLGGWTNPLSIQWFENYSRIIFERFASKVKYWITITQPTTMCFIYGNNMAYAPKILNDGDNGYLCVKNMILAHAKVYRMYEKEYKNTYNGSLGLSLLLNWMEPKDSKAENVEAADIARAFTIDFVIHPIWSKRGDFPDTVKQRVARKSKEQGFHRSRLPELSASEVEIIKGSADFLGINHFTTHLVSPQNMSCSTSYCDDIGLYYEFMPEWKKSQSEWLRSYPYGLYKLCIYLNEKYNYPQIIITEHGWSTTTGLQDHSRVEHMREYLNALLFAIEDGTDVRGYSVWSLMDNVEWLTGTSERFGLYEVDFESDDKKRKARLSALVYKRIIDKRMVEKTWTPKNLKIERYKDEL